MYCVAQHVFKCARVCGLIDEGERRRKSSGLLMKDDHSPLTSYLLQGQWRRSGLGAALVCLVAHSALFLLALADGGVMHHD